MLRCLAMLLGLSLAALAGGRPVVAQAASDSVKQAPADQPAPASATDKPEAKIDRPATETNKTEQADGPAKAATPVPATPLTTAPTPAPVVVAPPPSPPASATTPPAAVATTPPAAVESETTGTAPLVDVALPTAKPVLVETPLPRDRPEISERTIPAKLLFAAKTEPSRGKAQSIGYYPKGCLAGGVELPINGPTWQVIRLSRNRNWGHPSLVRFLKRIAPVVAKETGWPGILVGDMGQPRGGPTPFGHKSHQTGLDVDIWFRPMPDHRLSKEERETLSALNLVTEDGRRVNPKTWTPAYAKLIRTAAEQPEVERVLVNAAIKKELCRLEGKQHWRWMAKVRPWYAHHDHIHVRLKCPAGSPHCKSQPAVPGGDGCGKSELAFWFSDKVLHPKPKPGGGKPAKQVMLADLPAACKTVLDAPAKNSSYAAGEK